jgi:hypothetical protein
MNKKRVSWLVALTGLSVGIVLSACGARTGLREEKKSRDAGTEADVTEEPTVDAGPMLECEKKEDCEGWDNRCEPSLCERNVCVKRKPKICDDNDPCTDDECQPATGECVSKPTTFDLDKDGHNGPRPGFKPGSPGSCGDDCDDTSAAAFPGGIEICDGVDNDCNGIVDDNAAYIPVNEQPILVSETSFTEAGAGGIAYSSDQNTYLTGFTGKTTGGDQDLHIRMLDNQGMPTKMSVKANGTTGDASGGAVVWTGDRFGVSWEDRRDDNYEIYFNTFGPDGNKLGPDQRLSIGQGFSVNSTIGWNGKNFYVFWQDNRSGSFEVFGRRVTLDATPLGNETTISDSFDDAESPFSAVSSQGIAIVYRAGNTSKSEIMFHLLNPDLTTAVPPVTVASGELFESPQVIYNEPNFVVLYTVRQPFRIFGAVYSPKGELVVPPLQLTANGTPHRSPAVLPLGDRLVLVASRFSSSTGYDLISQALTKDLAPLGSPQIVSQALGNDLGPALSFGPEGNIGVFYSGKISNGQGGVKGAAMFSRLVCTGGQ